MAAEMEAAVRLIFIFVFWFVRVAGVEPAGRLHFCRGGTGWGGCLLNPPLEWVGTPVHGRGVISGGDSLSGDFSAG